MSGLDDLLLPAGSRIVHIGPHKTGTTAIQGAFADARDRIGAYGVRYPDTGDSWQAYRPALALTGTPGHRGTGAVDAEEWPRLVREIERYGEDRVLISSESFSRAEPDRIARLREDLDPERVQVVRMIRRYDTLLPSLWQQRIVDGYDRHWQRYVGRPLNAPDGQFWERFGIATLTRRWADVVGADRVTVVVVDERDHGWLLRVMERLVGLPEGTLVVGDDPRYRNRSLSWAEAEMVRQVNLAFNTRGWSDEALRHYVRFGIKRALKPFPAEPAERRPRVSPARYAQLEELTRKHWEELHALGVRVVGELDWLLPPRHEGPEPTAPTAADPSAQGPLLLPAPKVVAAADAIVERAGVEYAPGLGTAVDLQPPAARPDASGPDTAAVWWRRRSRRTVVLAPLDEALAHWQQHLASGGTRDLDDLLPEVAVKVPQHGTLVVVPGTARSYDELAAVREIALAHPTLAATALAWLRASEPQPSYGVPEVVLRWARDRAAEIRAAVAQHRLRVVGDLADLEPALGGQRPEGQQTAQVPAVSAGLLLAGMIAGAHREPPPAR